MNRMFVRSLSLLPMAGLFLVACLGRAASVPPTGYTNAFDSLPSADDWATFSHTGAAADNYDLDADVSTNITAAGVTSALGTDAGNPPPKIALAVWSSSGLYVQTRPTGNRYTALMGKFVNATGTNATQVKVAYQLTVAGAGVAEDAGKGTHVYYSLTGVANQWTPLATLYNSVSSNLTSTLATNIALTWTNGAALYLLWVDDNANAQGDDSANEIDNFSLQVTAGSPIITDLTCLLAAPTNNAVYVSSARLTTAATILNGTAPFTVQYFISAGAGNSAFTPAGSSVTAPYAVDLGTLAAGTYNLYAVVTDSAAAPVSTNSVTNTFFVADPLMVTLTGPADGAMFDHLTSVTGTSTVTGGTPPYGVQFYFDHAPVGPLLTSAPFDYNFGPLPVGTHTISVTATDARGWVSNSSVAALQISGPLAATLTPTNGTSYEYGQPVILTATAGGGTPPYTVTLYTNDQLVASFNAPPFTTNLGILPEGSYTAYVVATDSSSPAAQQAASGTNVIVILPNPIAINLTTPTNGQSASAGQALALTATASVGAPVLLTNVEFFVDGVSVGSDSTSPFAGSYANPVTGSHTVYAAATDNLGRKGYSSTNQLTVVANTGPPPNDAFNSAIALTGPIVTTTGRNTGATKERGEPFSAGNFGGASVWWTWTATASGQTTIDTSGSDFNTLLGVYTGTAVNRLTLVADNNDYNGNTWSRVQFNAVAGTVYRISVDGFAAGGFPPQPARGNIVLHVQGVGGLEITSPTNGMVFTVGDSIPVDVTIRPDFPNPPAARVDFYLTGARFASVSNAPFSAVATNVPAGSNSIYVVAIDNLGTPVQSPIVTVFVQSIGVTLLTPFDDTVFLSTNPISVTAWGYLPSGSITNVEFFVDGLKFGEDSTAPYGGLWTNVLSGSHRLTAMGRSDAGGSYVSQPVNIGVGQLLVHSNAVWKYLDDGSDQGTAWSAPDFDDSAWASGPAELGYGDGDEATVVHSGPTNNYYITTYFRRSFVASNVASLSNLVVWLAYDDAAAVYLNGRELYRTANLPTNATATTFATGPAIEETVDLFTRSATNLVEGTNVVAVEIHQQAVTSSDISFFLQMVGVPYIIHNFSPQVALTNPTNDEYYLAPPLISLDATASDADGTVAKVEFFADNVKLGEAMAPPYHWDWDNPPIGPHTLVAVATDDQGATGPSAPIHVIVYDALGTPFARVTAPADGVTIEGGTNLVVSAYANAVNGVTNVQFLSNGAVIGEDASAPYAIVWDAPFGTNALTAVVYDATGNRGTSAVVTITVVPNTTPPTIATRTPAASSIVTNLTSVTLVFSEPVHGVDASDLLINGHPATNVIGSGLKYTFAFAQPPYGAVDMSIAAGHGITDFGYPADLPFDEQAPGARWSYTLIDKTPPTILARTPAAGSTVTNLTNIVVTFSEPVQGVDAADLLINGTAAVDVSGAGAAYTFRVVQPPSGTINVTWATNHGITDVADVPNAFNGSNANAIWSFVLDTRTVLVQSNATWLFLKGYSEASTPVDAWRQLAYDDTGWSNAPAPFFYGDPYTNFPAGIFGTLLSDMRSNYTSIFLRKEFTVPNPGVVTNLFLNAQSDDGFIAWINGVEVLRYNVPAGEVPFDGTSPATAPEPTQTGAAYIVYGLTNAASALVRGTNVLAVHAFNESLTTSSDFGFNAQLYTYLADPSNVPPRLAEADPAPGEVFALTNLVIAFSEAVSGVDAGDLLVNGVPTSAVRSETNTVYTFSFAPPAFGPVLITWVTNHGIVDFDAPPRAFDGTAASSVLSYTLVNPSNPRIATQLPLANTVVTGLTSIAITFTEPVAGVDAADLLINTVPATAVNSADNTTFVFGFPQPPFGAIAIRWATNHGITDLENAANPFDPTRVGAQWNYRLIDPVPSVAITSPTNGSYVLAQSNVVINANASDNDGTVARVEFFADASKLGEATNAPYSVTWSNVPAAFYFLRAVATDNSGLMGTSAPVVLNVVTSLPAFLVRGPYLQIGSPTGGVVRWRTDRVSDSVVNYGTDPTALTNSAADSTPTNEHIVSIAGLQPATRYFYSIGSSVQKLVGTNGVGSAFWFKTSPVAGTHGPTRLWVIGDAGTAGNGPPDRQASTRDAYLAYAATNGAADLFLMLGDNAYNSGQDTEYQAAVFDMYPMLLRNLFLWPTIGNHESNQSFTSDDYPYLHIFSLPHNGEAGGVPSGTQKYYSFDYANIHFICLDSMTSGRTTNTAMVQWLQQDLEAATADWVIVFFHHPAYTKGNHDSDRETELIEIRQNILPILESHGVDLVLNGHSHDLERSYLLNGFYGDSSTITDSMKIDAGDGREDGTGAYMKNASGQGVVYNVAGNAGQVTGGPLNHPAHFLSLNELGSLIIDVSSNRLDTKFLTPDGSFHDHYTLLKRDLRPAAPIDLVAVPSGATQVTLSWTDVAVDELGYSVERSLDGVNFTEVFTTASDVTNIVDRNLTLGLTYVYRVRSTNAAGVSDYSNLAGVTAVDAATPPAPPAGLTALSGFGDEAYRSQILLTWHDRSTNESAFQIERSEDGFQFLPVATVAANLTSYRDHDLASGTAYSYRVRALNPAGASAPSALAGTVTHPQSQVVLAGTNAVFRAGVEGVAPIRYQWLFNDAPLAGQTNEALVLTEVQSTNEGSYRVVVIDAVGHLVSNPAYLFVVSPPSIVAQPQDVVGVAGTPASFVVVARGTSPLTYHWRKDGVDLGAGGAKLTLSQIQLADRGAYDVVVENDFGSATSRAAALQVYALPMLASQPDILAEVRRALVITNRVSDPNVPPLKLKYELAAGSPANARINPNNGIFSWIPKRDQGGTTNLVTISVRDEQLSMVSNAMSFTVVVSDCVEVTAGSTAVLLGDNGTAPIEVFSSASLLGLQCTLDFAPDRLTDLTVEEMLPAVAHVAVEFLASNRAALTFTAAPGQSMQGTQQLARVRFNAATGQHSGFTPLHLGTQESLRAAAGLTPTLFATDGRVALIGAEPLLDAHYNAQGRRELTIYGNRGVTYTVQSSTNLSNPNAWVLRGLVVMSTNITKPVPVGDNPAPPAPAFFRAK